MYHAQKITGYLCTDYPTQEPFTKEKVPFFYIYIYIYIYSFL
jgi:hypothetical protein